MKLRINEDGILEPILRGGLTPRSLAKLNMDVVKRLAVVAESQETPPQATPTVGEPEVVKEEVMIEQEALLFHCERRDFEMFQSTSYSGV